MDNINKSINELQVQMKYEGFIPVNYNQKRQRQIFNQYFQQTFDFINWKKIGELKKKNQIDELDLFLNGNKVENNKEQRKKSENEISMKITFTDK